MGLVSEAVAVVVADGASGVLGGGGRPVDSQAQESGKEDARVEEGEEDEEVVDFRIVCKHLKRD